jgi:hypothetical protein
MFFKLLSFVLLFHIFMSNVYPDEHIQLLLNLSYYCIYVYTLLEMKVKHIYLQITNDNPKLLEFMKYISKKSVEDNIEIISDNQVINTSNKHDSNWFQLIPDYCKFIIYSVPDSENSTIINKKIIHNTKNIQHELFNCETCKYTFISVDLYIQNELKQQNYDLNLFFNGNNNYYVVNNKIDKFVICFLLYSRHGVYQKPDTCKYKLSIIDQNANMVEVCEKDVIMLYKEHYEIIEVIRPNDFPDKEDISDSENEESGEESKNSSDESYEKINN